jgi:hypothetical protein
VPNGLVAGFVYVHAPRGSAFVRVDGACDEVGRRLGLDVVVVMLSIAGFHCSRTVCAPTLARWTSAWRRLV